MAKIADLFVKIGLDGQGDVSKGLDKVSGSLKELFSMSIRTKLTLAGIVAGLTGATISFGKTASGLSEFHRIFGLSTDDLQRYQQAAENFQIDGDEVAGTIGKIQDALAQARTNEGYAETFTKMGIDPSQMKDAYQVMETLRKRVQGGQLDIMRVLSSGFLSEKMFGMLRETADPLKMKLARPILSPKEIAEGQKMAVSLDRFGKDLKRDLDKFIYENRDLIKETMELLKTFLHEGLTLIRWISSKFGIGDGKKPKEISVKDAVDSTGSIIKDIFLKLSGYESYSKNVAEGGQAYGPGFGSLSEKMKIYGPTMEQAGFDPKKAALPVTKEPYKPMLEEQVSKNVSNFYMDITDKVSQPFKSEAERLTAYKQVNAGNR